MIKRLTKYRLWLVGIVVAAIGLLLAFGRTEECKPLIQALISLIVGL